uniref:EGF-like domain-containing protein n=1 Tax=Parastrongyloides trichosuri TaxID=131310 RepID=A0A0N5A151_PARTI
MKYYILLLLGLVVASAFSKQQFPLIFEDDAEHIAALKKFHHTWTLDKEVSIDHNLLNPKEFSNYDSINYPQQFFTTGCSTPGYTGAHCEFPICDMPSRPDFDHNAENVVIDFAVYPTCNQTMALYIDDHMYEFYVEVQTLGSYNPFAELYNATGYPIVPTNFDSSNPNRLILTYDRQPAGIYQVIPQSDVPASGCYVQVSGVSQMDIHLGFVQYTGNNRDPERSDFPSRNVYLNSLNLITAHPHNLFSPGSIAAITIYQQYNMVSRPEPMNLRYGCSYEYYLNALHCSSTGNYYAKIDGYDFFGNSFRRVIGFVCEVNPNPPVTTTTTAPPPVTACKNNGQFVSNGNSSYCYCGPLFTGSDCSQVICLNGGTSIGGGLCMCNSGFTGDQCQDVRCTDDSGFNFPKDYPVPTFVIRVRSQMSSIIKQINTQISALAVQFQSAPYAFQNFGLVTFNNNGSTFDGQYYSSVEDLQTALLNLANTQDSTGDCMDTTFEAINYAFNRFIIGQRSPVYVFTDAIPSDPDYISNVIEFNSFILSPIYIFQLEPTEVTCQSTDMFTPAWNALQAVAAKSSGNLFFIGATQYSSVGSLFYNHMYNTYYRGDLMLADDADECLNQQKYSTVSIDSGFETLAIVASGSQLDLILTSPEGKFVTPATVVQLNYTSIWTLSGLEAGQWQINMVSGDPRMRCSIRVYAAIPPERAGSGPSRTLYWGWTTGLTYDSPLRQPLLGLENSMVLHIDGTRMAERHRLSAEVAIYERTETGKILSFAANGMWRDECQFEIYFPKYTCNRPDQTLYFTVYFRDDNDFMAQRAGAMYCAEFRPTQVPPGTCQNGGFSYNNTCICPTQYTGPVCETPVCWNGGTPNRDHCNCVVGFDGTFCELSTCVNTNPETDFGSSHKTMRCVYMSGTWAVDDCTVKRQFMCQAHKFSDSFDPSPSEERTLPPGKWSAVITNPGKTVVQIKVQSELQLLTGYTVNQHDDFPLANPQAGTTANMMLAHIPNMATITRDTLLVNTQIYDFYNNTMYAAANYELRADCVFQFQSEPFICPNSQSVKNAFSSLSTGFDEYGFTFQRMRVAHCAEELATCGNGGVVYNGMCVCGEYWTGAQCEQPICVNNGTLSNDSRFCTCPVGYEGIACEREVCTTNSPDNTDQYNKTFALVVENTSLNTNAIKQIQQNLQATLNSVKAGWFTQYVLVVVDSNNTPYLKISTNVNDFQTNLLQITPADSTTSCGIPLYNAMSTALHQINVANSVLYVVARSIPSDLSLEVSFVQLVAQKQPQFYYHSITGDSGCTTNFNDPATNRLQHYTIASGGNFIATTGATVGSLMNVYIPPMFTGGVLNNPTVRTGTCNSTDVLYLLIDSATTDIIISMYSNYPSVSVISPSGQIEVLKTLYSDSNVTSGPKLSIFTVSSIDEFGMYSFTLHGSGACYAQVKSTGGAELYLGYVPSPSATSNIGSHLDNSTSVPLNDYNMFVGKVVDDFARITYAEILDLYTNEFQYVKFYRRGNCTHNYYSDPFKCGQGLLIIKYFGIDAAGQMFVRDGFTLCLNAGIPTLSTTPIPSGQTTTTLPSAQTVTIPSGQTTTTAQQSGVTTTTASSSSLKTDAANIYLVLDTSSAVPASSYSTIFSNFVAQILAQYNVSPQYINVALSGSPGDSNLWLTNPTFNTFTSLSMLKNSINGSYYPIDGPQSSGQSQLSSVIGQATNVNFLATGYNAGNIPHLIIYLTTTSTPDNNAISTGQTIINGKQFQIISIAYGSSLSNTNALQSMSSCVYTASSVNDLNNLASTLTSKLSSSYSNNGIYAC